MTNTNVVPFGKYKDQPVERLMADRKYCEWLAAQPWFAERYRNIYNIIMHVADPDAPTPEHNAMQVRFLQDDLCIKLAKEIFFNKEQISLSAKTLLKVLGDRDIMQEHLRKLKSLKIKIAGRQMEVHADVSFEAYVGTKYNYYDIGINDDIFYYGVDFYLELKPTIGDDYPAIIRQMVRQRKRLPNRIDSLFEVQVLIYEKYTGIGATEKQMRQIFSEADFEIFRLDEIM